MLFHGYKESGVHTSPLSPKIFSIPFSNWLLLEQGKWSCRCFVEIFLEKQGWREWAPSWEWRNFSLLTEFTNQFQLSKTQSFVIIFILPPITPTPSFHLWYLCPTLASTILKWPTKRASLRRALCHWRYKTEATQTAGQRQASSKAQGWSTIWPAGLRQYQWGFVPPGPPLHCGNYSDRAY